MDRRRPWPQEFNGALGPVDVRRIADDRHSSHLSGYRNGGAGAAAGCADGARPFGRGRIWNGSDLYERGGRQGTTRVLFIISIRHAGWWPAVRPSGGGDTAADPVARRSQAMGMADPLLYRRARGRGRDVSTSLVARDRFRRDHASQGSRLVVGPVASQAGSPAGSRIHHGRIALLLHVYDLHAEI